MTKKAKEEEERVERIIRALLKLPENRRCINCNSLGPQYVCTTFLTFVCTNCSGVHREFTHRVKSVSMAKFNAEEVSALQAGGNERARQIYFKDWDPHRNAYPDGSNLHRLRDFIKHVYIDRKYCGQRNLGRLPNLRLNEDSYDSRKVGRNPHFEDRCERRLRPDGGNDDRRSPGYARESSRYGGLKKNPVRFEIVDDRFRDDGIRSGRESDSHRFSHRESSFGSLSPDNRKNRDQSSSPVVRPVKDFLGENAIQLQVGERSKATDRKDADASASNQMITSSSGKGSMEGKPVKDKDQNSESLIDFDAPSMPSDAAAVQQTHENHQFTNEDNSNSSESSMRQVAPPRNTLEFLLYELSVPSVEPSGNASDLTNNDNPTTTGNNMFMSSGGVSEPVSLGQLLSLPNDNSTPINSPGGNEPTSGVLPTASMGQMLALPNIASASATAPGGNMPTVNDSSFAQLGQLPTSSDNAGGISSAAPVEKTLSLLDTFDTTTPSATDFPVKPSKGGTSQALLDILGDSTFKVPNGQQASGMLQLQLSAFPTADSRSSELQTSTATVEALNNQPWTSSEVHNAQKNSNVSAVHPSQDIRKAEQDSNSVIKSQHLSVETSGRKELPADLFTASYSFVPGSVPGWQNAVPYGMGFNMQYYPNATPMQPYPKQNQAISSNPFDFNNDNTMMQVSQLQFPSLENLQTAIPNVSAPGALSPSSSIGTNSSGIRASHASFYASAMPLQTPYLPPSTSSGAYMGQQLHINAPHNSRPQGAGGGFGSDTFFGSPNMTQQSSSGYPLSSIPSYLPSAGGNPFG